MPYKNILLIDDDSDDTLFFVEALSAVDKPINCRTILNPARAWEELQVLEELPDIIFLDYNMPLLTGLEFIKRMQGVERLKNVEVIVLSTPSEQVMAPWLETNNTAVKYISKPDSIEELTAILQELL
ncbi:response regulator [Flavobacterium sp. KBS0721]|jgi:CheY-like chemotaxis protein|uniref:response regulator n=1 Tax=Flavobacterium sp. KBS0721 TaxID=1179672 RepID=UPI00098F03A4|nr:response regulator [Flavobacterium sp. KBS0721]QDW21697.1 response regulator [Flavobacterium sp. KBS0721]